MKSRKNCKVFISHRYAILILKWLLISWNTKFIFFIYLRIMKIFFQLKLQICVPGWLGQWSIYLWQRSWSQGPEIEPHTRPSESLSGTISCYSVCLNSEALTSKLEKPSWRQFCLIISDWNDFWVIKNKEDFHHLENWGVMDLWNVVRSVMLLSTYLTTVYTHHSRKISTK